MLAEVRFLVTRKTELNKPLSIDSPSRLIKNADSPIIDINQIVIKRQQFRDSVLNVKRRHRERLVVEYLSAQTRIRCPVLEVIESDVLRRVEEEFQRDIFGGWCNEIR